MAAIYANLQNYWEADDFQCLQSAGHAVNVALRMDEAAANADTYGRSQAAGTHRYYYSSSSVATKLEHARSEPLPPLLRQHLASAKVSSFLGLLLLSSASNTTATTQLAYLTVDRVLYLWNIADGVICSFSVPSGQPIVSVGLVPPKKGVFQPTVTGVLVVTTPDEVLLCALLGGSNDGSQQHGHPIQLVPTHFRVATDLIRMLKIAGDNLGRIFLGGHDGNVYEIEYGGGGNNNNSKLKMKTVEDRLNGFYDGDDVAPSTLQDDDDRGGLLNSGRKRFLDMSSTNDNNDGYHPSRKCRKLNHGGSASSSTLLTSVLPSFLTTAGNNKKGCSVIALVTDQERNALYSLSSNGMLTSYRLGGNSSGIGGGGGAMMKECACMNLKTVTMSYLEAVCRGQLSAPRYCRFGSGAANGVGRMEGARVILRQEHLLEPKSLHLVQTHESSTITAVVVTAGGIRLYLSSLASAAATSSFLLAGRSGSTSSTSLGRSWTLCHVRAPPALTTTTSTTTTNGSVGSNNDMPQSSAPCISRQQRVDASWYGDGCMVAAADGQHFWGTAPDSILRPVNNNTSSNATSTSSSSSTAIVTSTTAVPAHQMALSGGITETVLLPIQDARGSAPTNQTDTLPGGVVYDIGMLMNSNSSSNRKIWDLMRNSQTPTAGELALDLPPPYFPPRKIVSLKRQQQQQQYTGSSNGGVTTLARTDLTTRALQVTRNVLWNALWSRPLTYGIWNNGGVAGASSSSSNHHQPDYRLSTRVAAKGFSRTAQEGTRKSATTGKSMSARLRSWLLRPKAVPLAPLATHHLVSENGALVALNVNGLHYFSFSSILSRLADALIAAGDNVIHDERITEFFTAYGPPEGCAMCLALAAGCGGVGVRWNNVGRRAIDAVLAKGLQPSLSYRPSTMNNTATTTTTTSGEADPLLPQTLEFHSSALYKGMVLLVSRLLRPIWHKPAVVVTEGRNIKTSWTTQSPSTTPAKVEVLLDDAVLDELRAPLRKLASIMRDVFGRAVQSVPGGRTDKPEFMDIDIDDSSMFSRGLQHQSQLRTGDAAEQLSVKDAEQLAHLLEEKNIHVLYRLVSRAIQLLNLMSLLLRAQEMVELQQVDWGLLHGLTIAQLVQTAEGQDRLETLLNSLITAGGLPKSSSPSANADHLALQFTDECYLFFSPGSQYAYRGLREAAEATRDQSSTGRRTALASQAAANLLRAAGYWHSAPLITGRILHRNSAESYENIARRAIECGSPLAVAVDALIQLHDVANAVQVCLLTAHNFRDDQQMLSGRPSNGALVAVSTTRFALPWEANLYHKRRAVDSNGLTSSTSSPSQTHVQGATVTNADAARTCFALIFYHLNILLSNQDELGARMVSKCAASEDRSFLDSFFLYLYDSGHKSTLLRIDSRALEKWIRDRHDAELLWRYFTTQNRFVEAGHHLWEHAQDPNSDLALEDRIGHLTRAQTSFESALNSGQAATSGVTEDISREVDEVRGLSHLARLQSGILQEVEKRKDAASLDDTIMPDSLLQKLRTKLMDASDLFNDCTAPLHLDEYSLRIYHTCKFHDNAAIHNTWTFLIAAQVLPCSTRDPAAYQFLQDLLIIEQDHNSGVVQLLQDHQASANEDALFERGAWIEPLHRRIVGLGQELYGNGADYIFPVTLLLSTLDGLIGHTDVVMNKPGWAMLVLAEAGVPYLILLDAYEAIVQKEESENVGTGDLATRLMHWDAMVSLLQHWTSAAQQYTTTTNGGSSSSVGTNGHILDDANRAQRELHREVASGRLQSKMEALRARLEATSGAGSLLDRLSLVEEMVQYLK